MKNFFSFIFINIFVWSLGAALLIFNFKATILDPANIKSILVDNQAYETVAKQIIPYLGQEIASHPESEENSPGGSAEVQKIFLSKFSQNVVDPKTLRSDTERVVDGVLAYLNLETDELNVVVDLTPYKRGLKSQLDPAVTDFINSLPVCKNSSSFNTESPDCRPAGYSTDQIKRQISLAEVKKTIDSLPNEFVISDQAQTDQNKESPDDQKEGPPSFSNVRNSLGLINTINLVAFALAVFSILAIFLIWWKKYRSSLRWVAGGLLSFAVLPLIISAIVTFGLNKEPLRAFVPEAFFPGPLQELGSSILLSLLKSYFRLLFWESLVLIFVAAAIFLGLTVWKEKKESVVEKIKAKNP